MNKKLLYSAPEAELLVVKFEGNFLQGPSNTPGSPSNGYEENPLDDLGD
jgi:hypothetical protein